MTEPDETGRLVSVIIPCFNAERWVGEAIKSALDQDYKPLEVIVVDDGSTDGSLEVVRRFGSRVRIRTTANRGGNQARNLGLHMARGDFVQFLDADDILAPGKIGRQVDVLLSSGADAAYGDWQYLIHELEGVRNGPLTTPVMGDDILASLITDFWCPLYGYLYRRDIVERVGGWDVTAQAIQDVRLALDLAMEGGRFVYVCGLTGHYRRHGAVTVSTRSQDRFNAGCLSNARKVEAYCVDTNGLTSKRRRALVRVYGQVARYYFEHDRNLFRSLYQHIRRLDGDYLPERPMHLRRMATLIGYVPAEYCAYYFRRMKKIFGWRAPTEFRC